MRGRRGGPKQPERRGGSGPQLEGVTRHARGFRRKFGRVYFSCEVGRNLVATIAGGQDCQRLDIAMSAAVNPGVKDTPVNLDTLLKAVGCPICGEMFTHPVTVVRPRPAIRNSPVP